jgi:hypothetical protein
VSQVDPHATQRRQLSERACELIEKYPCLHYNSVWDHDIDTVEEARADCVQGIQVLQHMQFPERCWDQWVASMECGIARTDYCPCDDNDCNFMPQSGDFLGSCGMTAFELGTCSAEGRAFGEETGEAGRYNWWADDLDGCLVMSHDPLPNSFQGDCSGPVGGGQACTCLVNGVPLGDYAEAVSQAGNRLWLANDCRDVARQMADGKCQNILSCCFTWSHSTSTGPEVQECACTSDPAQLGHESCQSLAASKGGTVVEMCGRYQPDPGSFPGKPKP